MPFRSWESTVLGTWVLVLLLQHAPIKDDPAPLAHLRHYRDGGDFQVGGAQVDNIVPQEDLAEPSLDLVSDIVAEKLYRFRSAGCRVWSVRNSGRNDRPVPVRSAVNRDAV